MATSLSPLLRARAFLRQLMPSPRILIGERSYRARSERGLTLIEIMVVLIILSLVMAWLGTGLFAKGDEAKQRLTQLKIKEIGNLIGQFQLQYNKLPNSFDDLTKCTELTGQNCIAVTSDDKLLDAWSGKFVYSLEEGGRRYRVKSLGRDGKEGGEGADADLFGTGP
jgi:general secretion pathway protein G